MKEKDLYKKLRKALTNDRIILQRIESPMTASGIPDLCYSYAGVNGFIELKYMKQWPKRSDTRVRIPHFSKAQKLWLYRHFEFGNRAFLLIQIEDDYLLFKGKESFLLEDYTKDQFLRYATWHSKELDRSILEVLR